MIPILLQAHTRTLTKIIYNKEGDLLFSSSKDEKAQLWRTRNGERLGSFNGHSGAIWSIDVTEDSKLTVTGSADSSAKCFDVLTGKCLQTFNTDTGVRDVTFDVSGNAMSLITDATMGFPSTILTFDIRSSSISPTKKLLPCFEDEVTGIMLKKPTKIRYTDCNEYILSAHDDGHLCLWDQKNTTDSKGSSLKLKSKPHSETIRDIQWSKDRSYFITASKDTSSKLIETQNLKVIKTYQTERPVNSAAISPIRPEVLIAGGQEAIQVTTSSSRAGQFEARFFHEVWSTEIGRVKGHFGPINTLAYHPRGIGYASGAEDGYIRLHQFDPSYDKFSFVETTTSGDALEEPLI